MSKRESYSVLAVFCILLFGFAAVSVIKPSAEFSETENRVLAQRPAFRAETVLNGSFESDYEEFLTDQFFLRNQWIGLKTSMERFMLKRECKDVYFADDGYLIEKHTGTFTSDTAARNIDSLSRFAAQYRDQFGAGHLSVMMIPNAEEVLSGKLPPFAALYSETDYLNRAAAAVPAGVWFDADSVLKQHAEEAIFYRTDHHWKTLAAFYVYREWAGEHGYFVPEYSDYEVETVTDSFEGTIQSKLGIRTTGDSIELFLPKNKVSYLVQKSDFSESDSLYDYPSLETKDKYAVFLGGNQDFMKITTESDSDRKILIIKDSYANCFIPFMIREFRELDILDLRYTNQKLSELIADGGYTDLLILYNAAGFAEDRSITKLLN